MAQSYDCKTVGGSTASPSQSTVLETHPFGKWSLTASTSHILSSTCTCQSPAAGGDFETGEDAALRTAQNPTSLPKKEKGSGEHSDNYEDVSSLTKANSAGGYCDHCRFERDLPLKELPEMVFPKNILRLQHVPSRCTLSFDAFDALSMVDYKHAPPFKVAPAAQWQEGIREASVMAYNEADVKKYDWTFRTPYSGTLTPALVEGINTVSNGWKAEEYSANETRIPLDKLKRQDKIFFYKEITLFEDELSDNGCSILNVRVRAMSDFVFILLRHFFRLDHVHVRIQDTRIYLENNSDEIIREISVRDCPISQLKPGSPLTQPDALWTMVPLISSRHEGLTAYSAGSRT